MGKKKPSIITGWWFQTWLLFSIIWMDVILPIDELIFFKMVFQPPTSWKMGFGLLEHDLSDDVSVGYGQDATHVSHEYMASMWNIYFQVKFWRCKYAVNLLAKLHSQGFQLANSEIVVQSSMFSPAVRERFVFPRWFIGSEPKMIYSSGFGTTKHYISLDRSKCKAVGQREM